jgi:serine/threonine protein kinase
MEKVQGKTLRDWIIENFFQDKNKIINSKRVLNVLLQIATGLHFLHKKKFIHQ